MRFIEEIEDKLGFELTEQRPGICRRQRDWTVSRH